MNAIFTYNEQQAATVGAGEYVTKSGGYDVKIVRAQLTSSQSSQAQFLELDLATREGLKCNYVSVCFKKGDGSDLDFGQAMIQSIMGCAGVGSVSADQQGNCTELVGKSFKAILQRVDYTKNNGGDGYKLDLKLPALLTGQTIKEKMDNKPAQSFASYAESVEDKDERKAIPQATGYQQAPQMAPAQQPVSSNGPAMDMSMDDMDNIPF